MTAMLPDRALPALDRLTDRAELARLIERLEWLTGPDGERAALRLRWKPGTNVRVGAVVPTVNGPTAVLIAAFTPATADKADKLAARALRRAAPVHRGDGVVAVPGFADPDLGRLVPPGVPLSYNPARRWVGRVGGEVVKVHAVAPPLGVAALLAEPPGRLGRHLPTAAVYRGGRVVRTAWVSGEPPAPADLPAVREALSALHSTRPPGGLPVLDAHAVLRAADAAHRSVVTALPGERARMTTLLGVLRRACAAGRWPAPVTLVHGDFSPDQVVVHGERALLLDLDRAGIGPAGWDAAQWRVAQLAGGPPVLPAPTSTAPVLVLAAAILRAPEPFRRLRPAWMRLTRAVLDAADDAAREMES